MEIYFSKSKSSPTQHKEKRLADLNQMSSDKTGQQHSTKNPRKASAPKQTKTAECHSGDLETKPDELNTANCSSERDSWRKTSVTTQTDESLCPHSTPLAFERHHAHTQTEEEEDRELSSASVLPALSLKAAGDNILTSTFPIPADPAQLAERILRSRAQLSAAFDDTEYEPYGLPEVVMKGNIFTYEFVLLGGNLTVT